MISMGSTFAKLTSAQHEKAVDYEGQVHSHYPIQPHAKPPKDALILFIIPGHIIPAAFNPCLFVHFDMETKKRQQEGSQIAGMKYFREHLKGTYFNRNAFIKIVYAAHSLKTSIPDQNWRLRVQMLHKCEKFTKSHYR
jgi:hypothetical protein